MISKINISDIKRLEEMQPRASMNSHVIDDYTEDIKSGAKFPPLDVFNVDGSYILVDGFHRLLAAQQAGLKKVHCEIKIGTKRDAFLFAAGVNSTHGFRRTNEDKRKAVERLLNDAEWKSWSDNKIAEICRVSDFLVNKMRGEIHTTINGSMDQPSTDATTPESRTFIHPKTGNPTQMNVENIGKKVEIVAVVTQNPTEPIKDNREEIAKNFLNNISSQYFLMVNDLMQADPKKYPTITDVICAAITLLSEQGMED